MALSIAETRLHAYIKGSLVSYFNEIMLRKLGQDLYCKYRDEIHEEIDTLITVVMRDLSDLEDGRLNDLALEIVQKEVE